MSDFDDYYVFKSTCSGDGDGGGGSFGGCLPVVLVVLALWVIARLAG